jgi:hypothetical protein
MTFDGSKLHPYWRPGVGFLLKEGEAPARAVTLDELRDHIEVVRTTEGNDEADRLDAELQGLLLIKANYERTTHG